MIDFEAFDCWVDAQRTDFQRECEEMKVLPCSAEFLEMFNEVLGEPK
jgi:hypothetical protein